jgi:TatD DNase family protein
VAQDLALVDTHCHLDLEIFDADRRSVLERATAAGINRILVPALNGVSARRAIGLAEAHATVFAAVGIHPTEVHETSGAEVAEMSDLATHPKVVAIGEIGLDYFWVKDDSARQAQRQAFVAQLDWARQTQRPVILHMREENDTESGPCSQDMLEILRDWATDLRTGDSTIAQRPGVLHSFSGSLDIALRAIDLGFCIGVTGPVTFPSAGNRRQMLRALPLDRLLIETDAPFLAPLPHRGRRNEPAFVAHIADKIAQIQDCTAVEVAIATTATAARLFGWGVSA